MQKENDDLIQSNGMTVGQVRDLALRQSGQKPGGINMFTPNNIHNLKDEHFKADGVGGYQVAEHELNFYHVAQEVRSFNAGSGEKVSKASVQMYSQDMFKFMKDNNGFNGMSLFIVHDPTIKAEVKPAGEPVKASDALVKLQETAKEIGLEITGKETETELRNAIADYAVQSVAKVKADREAREAERANGLNNAGTFIDTNAGTGTQDAGTNQAPPPPPPPTPSLDWTRDQLAQHAEDLMIDVKSNDTKATLLDKIKAKMPQQ